jgi:hypothetical protein
VCQQIALRSAAARVRTATGAIVFHTPTGAATVSTIAVAVAGEQGDNPGEVIQAASQADLAPTQAKDKTPRLTPDEARERLAALLDAEDPITVAQGIKDIAKAAGITQKAVQAAFSGLRASSESGISLPTGTDDPFTEEEIAAATKLLSSENLFAEFNRDFTLTGYIADRTLTDDGLQLLGRTLLPKSSAEYGHGKLAAGKSEFYEHIADFFPLSRQLRLTTFSEKFLFHVGGTDGKALQGFLIVFGESDLTRHHR